MNFIADLHIHSPYSRATSKASTLPGLFAWARVKGINLVGTGDFTHPAWFSHLQENLLPAEPGFFRLKDENVPAAFPLASPDSIEVRFILTAEISSIYKRHGKVRKVHNILFAPDFASAQRINSRLAAIGNIESDGRPILGLDSRDLLEIVLEEAPDGFLVPAHIWTPWFSLFGSKSGFDSIEECYGDLSEHIFALETGLSSDPEMNRMISALDRYTLISNSDCHSPAKLGREVNMFSCDFDYYSMRQALKAPEDGGFKGTLEFFPEEGKYHFDGHRKCKVCLDPLQTRELDAVCPVCNKPLTIGVTHRVMELADREHPVYPNEQPGFQSIVPLPEVLGEILSLGPATKGVQNLYGKAINRFGSEFDLFLHTPEEDIRRFSTVLAEAINRIRKGKVIRQAGYDGEFGVIHLFEPGELDRLAGQASLFEGLTVKRKKKKATFKATPLPLFQAEQPKTKKTASALNPEQNLAVTSNAAKTLVTAGPGTGKTYTLIQRLLFLIQEKKADPNHIYAITFTNKAADELKERLAKNLPDQAEKVFTGTFHSFCLKWLREQNPNLQVIDTEEKKICLQQLYPELKQAEIKKMSESIASYLENQTTMQDELHQEKQPQLERYFDKIKKENCIDLDGVIPSFYQALKKDLNVLNTVQQTVRFLLVDEFQDLNRSQFELVQTIGAKAEIFAIGDPNQAIYGFRGSNLNFFFQFAAKEAENQTQQFQLTRNYRSAATILKASASVINNNSKKSLVSVTPQRCTKGSIEFFQAPTPKDEAKIIGRRIVELMGGISSLSTNSAKTPQKSFADFAVLYRTNRQAEIIGETLHSKGIPFQAVGLKPFFMKGQLKKISLLLLAAADMAANNDYLALLKGLKGFGEKALKLCETIPITEPYFMETARRLALGQKAHDLVTSTKNTIDKLAKSAGEQTSLSKLIPEYYSYLGIDPDQETERFEQLAGIFGSDLKALSGYLNQNAKEMNYDEKAESVSLMSLHAAKGLEFPVVFLAGLEENLLPNAMPGRGCDLEEERRLFYVGMTRAKDQLILSMAKERSIYGKVTQQKQCRFLQEIPPELITTVESPHKKRPPRKAPKQLTLF